MLIREDGEFSGLRPLLDWLDYNGFAVRTKPAKEVDDGDGRRKVNEAWAWSLPSMLWSWRAVSTTHFSSLAMETCKLSFKLCNGWA